MLNAPSLDYLATGVVKDPGSIVVNAASAAAKLPAGPEVVNTITLGPWAFVVLVVGLNLSHVSIVLV